MKLKFTSQSLISEHEHIVDANIFSALSREILDDLSSPIKYGIKEAVSNGFIIRLAALKDFFKHFFVFKDLHESSRDFVRHRFRSLTLIIFGGWSINDYYLYNIYQSNSSITDSSKDYVGYFRRKSLRDNRNCNTCSVVLRNKLFANTYFTESEIPTTNIVGFYYEGVWYKKEQGSNGFQKGNVDSFIENLRGYHIVKPMWMRSGEGISRLDFPKDTKRLMHVDRPVIIERLIENHNLLKISNSLNTVRIITEYVKGFSPQIVKCVIRVGLDTVDNWNAGGVAALIDCETGEIKNFYSKSPTSILNGKKTGLEGRHLPYWKDVVELVKYAHSKFQGLRSIGWDIAITEYGPILIEGNDDWGIVLTQRLASYNKPDEKFALPTYMYEKKWP